MDGKEAARLRLQARELRALAATMHSDKHRKLLLASAENFERLAKTALEMGEKPG